MKESTNSSKQNKIQPKPNTVHAATQQEDQKKENPKNESALLY